MKPSEIFMNLVRITFIVMIIASSIAHIRWMINDPHDQWSDPYLGPWERAGSILNVFLIPGLMWLAQLLLLKVLECIDGWYERRNSAKTVLVLLLFSASTQVGNTQTLDQIVKSLESDEWEEAADGINPLTVYREFPNGTLVIVSFDKSTNTVRRLSKCKDGKPDAVIVRSTIPPGMRSRFDDTLPALTDKVYRNDPRRKRLLQEFEGY